jgi:hypothetical protein
MLYHDRVYVVEVMLVLMRRERVKKNRIFIHETAWITTGYEVKKQAIKCKYSRRADSTALANEAVAYDDIYVSTGIKRYQLTWRVYTKISRIYTT